LRDGPSALHCSGRGSQGDSGEGEKPEIPLKGGQLRASDRLVNGNQGPYKKKHKRKERIEPVFPGRNEANALRRGNVGNNRRRTKVSPKVLGPPHTRSIRELNPVLVLLTKRPHIFILKGKKSRANEGGEKKGGRLKKRSRTSRGRGQHRRFSTTPGNTSRKGGNLFAKGKRKGGEKEERGRE